MKTKKLEKVILARKDRIGHPLKKHLTISISILFNLSATLRLVQEICAKCYKLQMTDSNKRR